MVTFDHGMLHFNPKLGWRGELTSFKCRIMNSGYSINNSNSSTTAAARPKASDTGISLLLGQQQRNFLKNAYL